MTTEPHFPDAYTELSYLSGLCLGYLERINKLIAPNDAVSTGIVAKSALLVVLMQEIMEAIDAPRSHIPLD